MEIGIIGRPHGVRGEVRALLHNPGSDILERVETVGVRPAGSEAGGAESYVIASVRPGPRALLLALEGVDDRDAALGLKGARLLVPRSAFPPPGEGEFYVDDLIGLEVRLDGARLGEIRGSRQQAGMEIVTVAVDPVPGSDSEEIEIPLAERFVVDLRVADGVLAVREIGDLPRHRPRGSRRP